MRGFIALLVALLSMPAVMAAPSLELESPPPIGHERYTPIDITITSDTRLESCEYNVTCITGENLTQKDNYTFTDTLEFPEYDTYPLYAECTATDNTTGNLTGNIRISYAPSVCPQKETRMQALVVMPIFFMMLTLISVFLAVGWMTVFSGFGMMVTGWYIAGCTAPIGSIIMILGVVMIIAGVTSYSS